MCIVNRLSEKISPRVIIPSVWFQPGDLAPEGETCESDYHLSGPDVCDDILRGDRIIARVGVRTFLGNMTVWNADRCEDESAPQNRTAIFGSALERQELATTTGGVKLCLNRWDTFQLTAYVAPSDRGGAYRSPRSVPGGRGRGSPRAGRRPGSTIGPPPAPHLRRRTAP
ncbi:MAG: hypothetical protein FJW77_06895 [Actinobacteria bacterium]|nr:hypothetical protein [Actinomycetota bacterium]